MELSTDKAPGPAIAPGTGLCLFQLTAVLVAFVCAAASTQQNHDTVLASAAIFFLMGGLPHGAFDIHRAAKSGRLGRAEMLKFTAIYVGIFVLMLVGWRAAPEFVLPAFLVSAALHFGADWPEADEPLFRLALGLAPICVIGLSNLNEVELIFATMANPAIAFWAAKIFVLVAPGTLLIAAVALALIGRSSGPDRSLVFAVMLVSLVMLPPVIGFALYFCGFHTPRHMMEIRDDFAAMKPLGLIAIGTGITALALAIGVFAFPMFLAGGLLTVSSSFQLLSALAMPHQSMAWVLRCFS